MISTPQRVPEPECGSELGLIDERAHRLLLRLPVVMLVIATGLGVAIDHADGAKLASELGLAAVCGLCVALMYHQRDHWAQRRPLMVAAYLVLLGAMAALVLIDGIFGFFTWTGYIWPSLMFDSRWRPYAYLPVATITATAQHGGLPHDSASSWVGWIVFVGINVLASGAISWFAGEREAEHDRRRQMVEELTEANAQLASSLEENAGLHAQLLAQAREAGMLDERQRMAGEIHDTLAQGLVGIITQLEAAAQSVPGEREWRRHTRAALELARESLGEARRSVRALTPAPLEQALLPDALAAVAAKWSERSRLAALVHVTGTPRRLPQEVELALLRTAQEALANVGKHASAARVVLTLSYMGAVVTLDIRDDGVGFEPSGRRRSSGGFGLAAMRRRVEALSGTLEIESEPGAGTTIAASLPVAGEGEPPPVAGGSTAVAGGSPVARESRVRSVA